MTEEGEKSRVRRLQDDYQINLFDQTVLLLEQNIRGVQIGIYSVACLGLAIALRSVRPFKKFSRPQQIPSEFFNKHVNINGSVSRIDFSPVPLLVVNHKPILFSKLREAGPGLKVKIESIDVAPNGIAWLQTLIVGQPVTVTLMSSGKDYVSSIVQYKSNDIGRRLVSLGFASVASYNQALEHDLLYKKYYQSLLKEEAKAETRALGMWNERQPGLLYSLSEWLKTKVNKFSGFRKVNY